MNNFKLVVLVSFCSLILSSNAYPVDEQAPKYPAFAILSSEYKEIDESSGGIKPIVNNMPPYRSQDGLNVCYAFSAATLYNQYCCKQDNSDCKTINPDTSISPFSFAAYGVAPDYKYGAGGLNQFIPYHAGGGAYNALMGVQDSGGYPESCYPFDQFVKNHGDSRVETSRAFERLRLNFYERNRTEGSVCLDCLQKELESEFNIKHENTAILKALSESTYDRFLFDIFLRKCGKEPVEPKKFFKHSLPDEDGKTFSYQEMMAKLKALFKAQTPVSVGLCLDKKVELNACNKAHDTVLSGYRKYCKPSGECRETVKVHNSWGKDWQDQNNDGWVDARTLYEYMDKKGKGAITWIQSI